MTTSQIQQQLIQQGYCHIKFPTALTPEKLSETFGKILFTTLIKENPKSARLLTSNSDVDLHTDHIKAKFIAWECNSQAAIGGESLLLDGYVLLQNIPNDVLNSLQNIVVNSHRLFVDDKSYYPLLSDDASVIYYAPFLCEMPKGKKEIEAYGWFQNKIKSSPKMEIKLSEGDWLIIDNHRILHGRKGFEQKSNRLLTRYWLSGQAK